MRSHLPFSRWLKAFFTAYNRFQAFLRKAHKAFRGLLYIKWVINQSLKNRSQMIQIWLTGTDK